MCKFSILPKVERALVMSLKVVWNITKSGTSPGTCNCKLDCAKVEMKSPRKTHNLFGNHIFLKLFCFDMSSKKVQAVTPVSLSLVRMCLFRVYFFPKLFFTAHITSPAPKFENVNTTKCQQLQKNVVTKQIVCFSRTFHF